MCAGGQSAELRGLTERLGEVKKVCERVLEERKAAAACQACSEAKLKEARAELAQRDSAVAGLKAR
jgi:hypothetical protein